MKFNHDKNKVKKLAIKHGWRLGIDNEAQKSLIFYKDDYRLTIWLTRGTIGFYIQTEPEFFKRNVDLDEIEEIFIDPPYEPNPHNGHY